MQQIYSQRSGAWRRPTSASDWRWYNSTRRWAAAGSSAPQRSRWTSQRPRPGEYACFESQHKRRLRLERIIRPAEFPERRAMQTKFLLLVSFVCLSLLGCGGNGSSGAASEASTSSSQSDEVGLYGPGLGEADVLRSLTIKVS